MLGNKMDFNSGSVFINPVTYTKVFKTKTLNLKKE